MGLGSTTLGTAVLSGQNGLRLEWRVDRSLSSASATLRLRIWAATRRSAFDSTNSFSVSGNWPSRSTSVSISHGSSSSWSSSNRTLVYDETITVTRQYGSSVSRSFSASLSGVTIVGGSTASVSGSVSVPARAYDRPTPPSSVSASRQSDTRTQVSWTRNPSTGAPYSSQQVRRRYWQGDSWSQWVARANLSGSATSYTDSHSGNVLVEYAVRAENSAGPSSFEYSNGVETTPYPPQSFSVRVRPTGNEVTWSTGAGFPAFTQVERQEDGGSWVHLTRRGPGWEEALHSSPNLAVEHRYRARHEADRVSGWVYSNTVQLAAPPSAPTGLGPSTVWDASEGRELRWTHVPTDASEQERFQVRHRLQGGEWTTVPAVASEASRWTLPGGTYSPGDAIEWQVRTMGVHPDWGPWSASNFQQPTSRPTVAINAPEDGSEIDTSSVLVTWGYAGPEQDDEGEISGQAAWRLTVLRGSNVVTEESGTDDRDEFLVRGLSDDAEYTIRVEVRSGEGLWSAEPDEVTISVSYLPPAPPQIGVAFDRDLGAAVVDVATAEPHEPYEYVNVVTNPRGRPVDTDAEADPLAARQALLDAIAAHTDAPVQWSTSAPGDTSVVWVDPGSGAARVWSAGVGGSVDDVIRRNFILDPAFSTLYGWTGTDSSQITSVPRGSMFPWLPDHVTTVVEVSRVGDGSVYFRGGGEYSTPEIGKWYALAVSLKVPADLTARVRLQFVGGGTHPTTREDLPPEGGVVVASGQTVPGDGRIWPVIWPTGISNDPFYVGGAILCMADTEAAALAAVEAYFDGDTPEHRTDNIIRRYAWDDEPHASPSTETALGQGWHEITDPDVVAAGEAYADAVDALAPVGWGGPGLWWSAEHDAVYVPQGTEATVPTSTLPGTVTLVLLDAETGESAQYWDRTDATIPADTVGRYLRAAIVEGVQFTGPYFDGDYPRGPGQDGSLATYAWDDEPHDSATTATITSLETESVQLWRAIDDGPWLLIADGVPPDTAISDPIPAIGDRRVNHYRATSVSGIGSAMHSDEHELVVPTRGPGGNHGWVYLNGGTDFSDVVKVRANATRSGSQGLAKSVRRYAGNPMAQERSGTAEHRTWSISINAREALYEDGASRPEEIDHLQRTGGVICYRDPLGARWFASMGMMDDSYQGITGEVSWPMEEVDQPEGLASEARDQSHGDEDDEDPGEEEPE